MPKLPSHISPLHLALPLALALCCRQTCLAQADTVTARRTSLLGAGRASQYDTYLSPLDYTGPQVSLSHQTARPLRRRNTVLFETLTQAEYSHTHNPAGSVYEHAGSLRFDAGWSRLWTSLAPGLSLSAGALAGASFGFLYNERNGNNPAQARLSARLSATVEAAWSPRIKNRHLTLRYKAVMPLLGCMFSPQYGQSYYNIFSQGGYDHNVLCTHPGNALSLRQQFTVSIPARRRQLTLGYASDLLQSKPHHLRQHQYSRYLLVGCTIGRSRAR